VQRANVKLKQGKLQEARVDYEEVVSSFYHTECLIFILFCQSGVLNTANVYNQLAVWNPSSTPAKCMVGFELNAYSSA